MKNFIRNQWAKFLAAKKGLIAVGLLLLLLFSLSWMSNIIIDMFKNKTPLSMAVSEKEEKTTPAINNEQNKEYSTLKAEIEKLKTELKNKVKETEQLKQIAKNCENKVGAKNQQINKIEGELSNLKEGYGQQPKASCNLKCIETNIQLIIAQARGALERGELDKSDDLSFDASLMINQFLKNSGYTEEIRKIRDDIRIARQLRVLNSKKKG